MRFSVLDVTYLHYAKLVDWNKKILFNFQTDLSLLLKSTVNCFLMFRGFSSRGSLLLVYFALHTLTVTLTRDSLEGHF